MKKKKLHVKQLIDTWWIDRHTSWQRLKLTLLPFGKSSLIAIVRNLVTPLSQIYPSLLRSSFSNHSWSLLTKPNAKLRHALQEIWKYLSSLLHRLISQATCAVEILKIAPQIFSFSSTKNWNAKHLAPKEWAQEIQLSFKDGPLSSSHIWGYDRQILSKTCLPSPPKDVI